MEGTSSVLFAREGTQDRLLQGATAYRDALDADADLLYADLHATKHCAANHWMSVWLVD